MSGGFEETAQPVEADDPTVAVLLCQGQCPAHRLAGPITCEGACSVLTTRWLARRLVMQEAEKHRGRKGNVSGLLLALLAAGGVLGCSRTAPAAAKRSTDSYAITVSDPQPVKVGARAQATIRVLPRGPYKINLEFPLKLKVSGPASASPRQLLLTLKQAAKLTKGELLLLPEFKLHSPGRHEFTGTLRFSVCTDAQCEIKTENVAWTVVSR